MEEIELKDISDKLLIINQVTIERLFSEETQNPLVLYLFYYKTAKWQKCNPIKASDDYCKKCLRWGEDKLRETKKKLKEMQLIETIKKTNEKGLVIGWYVKVNYLMGESTTPETTTPEIQGVDLPPPKILNNNSINTNNNINTMGRFVKPTLEEVKAYCEERQNGIDPETFIDFYESKGWMIGKNKVKDWRACVRTWEKNRKNKPDLTTTPDWFDKDLEEEKQEPNKELEELKDFFSGFE